MSRFFSRNFMATNGRLGEPITEDTPCPACGYNLRGLKVGQVCPECGGVESATVGGRNYRPLHDLILASDEAMRSRWRLGLGLASIAVAMAIVHRLAMFVLGVFVGIGPKESTVALAVGGVAAITWVVAVWLVTPSELVERWPVLRLPRWAARLLALMWIPAVAALGAAQALAPSNVADYLALLSLACRFLGGLGVMFTAFVLHHLAGEAELTQAARRLNAMVWFLWFPAFLDAIFPKSFEWIFAVPLAIILFFKTWLMMYLFLGCSALYQHSRWGAIHVAERIGRDARIEAKRREIERAVAATVRPLPKTPE